MTTTWVVPKPGLIDHRDAWENEAGAKPPHIDYVTNDLEGFLAQIERVIRPAGGEQGP